MEKSLKPFLILILSITLLVVAGAVWSELPLRDAVSMQPLSNFSLYVDTSYILLAPWLNILDLMSSLSLTQHIAWLIGLWLFISYMSFKCIQYFKPSFNPLLLSVVSVFLGLLVLVSMYAIAMLLPRPMATLVVPENDMLVVDFHSHTNASHDGNISFDAEDNRWWHAYAGFNAVFVTDHSTFAGIQAGQMHNTKYAQDGVLLLDGVEVFHKGGHILALCAKHIVVTNQVYTWQKHADEPCTPLLVQALPAPMSDSDTKFRERDIQAIEINDGAPLGLEEIKYREHLRETAKRLNIAVVSGSDNHGWAYTAVGWSILRIHDWQNMSADRLALAITDLIREQGFTSVQVVERNMLLPATRYLGHAVMPIRLVWHMFQTLSWSERLSWLAWLIMFALFAFKLNKRSIS